MSTHNELFSGMNPDRAVQILQELNIDRAETYPKATVTKIRRALSNSEQSQTLGAKDLIQDASAAIADQLRSLMLEEAARKGVEIAKALAPELQEMLVMSVLKGVHANLQNLPPIDVDAITIDTVTTEYLAGQQEQKQLPEFVNENTEGLS